MYQGDLSHFLNSIYETGAGPGGDGNDLVRFRWEMQRRKPGYIRQHVRDILSGWNNGAGAEQAFVTPYGPAAAVMENSPGGAPYTGAGLRGALPAGTGGVPAFPAGAGSVDAGRAFAAEAGAASEFAGGQSLPSNDVGGDARMHSVSGRSVEWKRKAAKNVAERLIVKNGKTHTYRIKMKTGVLLNWQLDYYLEQLPDSYFRRYDGQDFRRFLKPVTNGNLFQESLAGVTLQIAGKFVNEFGGGLKRSWDGVTEFQLDDRVMRRGANRDGPGPINLTRRYYNYAIRSTLLKGNLKTIFHELLHDHAMDTSGRDCHDDDAILSAERKRECDKIHRRIDREAGRLTELLFS